MIVIIYSIYIVYSNNYNNYCTSNNDRDIITKNQQQ